MRSSEALPPPSRGVSPQAKLEDIHPVPGGQELLDFRATGSDVATEEARAVPRRWPPG
ncbi:MAG: hypothetical protein QOK15_3510 [Nocardioidaceae bacterium]|jgi:hypothetical protein|nr:hypothetical protein [Nocardioidaceae bacterium]